jgi:hypothetical protein
VAAPFAIFFWSTLVLFERTAVNYQKGFLVYGKRPGMDEDLLISSENVSLFAHDSRFRPPGMGFVRVCELLLFLCPSQIVKY